MGRGGGGGGMGRGGGMNGRRGQAGSTLRRPRWDLNRLEPFKKDFYIPHPDVDNRWVHSKILLVFFILIITFWDLTVL